MIKKQYSLPTRIRRIRIFTSRRYGKMPGEITESTLAGATKILSSFQSTVPQQLSADIDGLTAVGKAM